jgi:hypothetical protein
MRPNGQCYVGMTFRRNERRAMPIDNRRNSKKNISARLCGSRAWDARRSSAEE